MISYERIIYLNNPFFMFIWSWFKFVELQL